LASSGTKSIERSTSVARACPRLCMRSALVVWPFEPIPLECSTVRSADSCLNLRTRLCSSSSCLRSSSLRATASAACAERSAASAERIDAVADRWEENAAHIAVRKARILTPRGAQVEGSEAFTWSSFHVRSRAHVLLFDPDGANSVGRVGVFGSGGTSLSPLERDSVEGPVDREDVVEADRVVDRSVG